MFRCGCCLAVCLYGNAVFVSITNALIFIIFHSRFYIKFSLSLSSLFISGALLAMSTAIQFDLFVSQEIRQIIADVESRLPSCPDDKRMLPNEVVRSALFTARNRRTPRAHLRNSQIAVIGTGTITYTGEELRQDDELVWMQLIHLAKKVPLSDAVEFTPYEFLKSISKTTGKENYSWLRNCLSRMQATAVAIYSERLGEGISASLIRKFSWVDESGKSLKKWCVWLEPEMRSLFDEVSWLNWEQRRDLPDGIASKLMGYWASHKNPLPVKLSTLQSLCGSTSSPREFKRSLIGALDELHRVKFLESFSIVNGLVSVRRLS